MDRETVFHYVKETFDVEPDYPWDTDTYRTAAVMRHHHSGKWFGLIMWVGRDKLGLSGEGSVDILNVKADPNIVLISEHAIGIMPAYHMSKKCWVSILLDGTVPDENVFALLDESYELTR